MMTSKGPDYHPPTIDIQDAFFIIYKLVDFFKLQILYKRDELREMYLDYQNEPERLIGSTVRATGVDGRKKSA